MLEMGYRTYSSDVQAHTHPFFQVVLPSGGALDLEVAGRQGCVHYGFAGFIGQGERHAFAAAATRNRFLVVDVRMGEETVANVRRLLEHLAGKRFAPMRTGSHHLIAYADSMMKESPLEERGTARSKALWFELLLESLSDGSGLPSDRSARAVARAKAFIDRFYDQPVRIPDLARVAGLSASRFHEIFQQRMGTTPGAYLAEVRLQRALELLATSSFSISEVALRTGYSDQSTLTRHVRRACGTTPAQYRRTAVSYESGSGEAAK